jgi:hypothetical protein
LFLGLGADCVKLDGSRHDAEWAEAKALAAHRWSRLLDLEGQVQREEQTLAARPKNRPKAPSDDLIASEVIERMATAFAQETDGMRAGVEQLKEQAKRERRELESLIVRR